MIRKSTVRRDKKRELMRQMDIDPQRPEFGIAKRIVNNEHFRQFLLAVEADKRREAYDALAPLVQFAAKPFDVLTATDS